jgi:hypothetical protein
MIIRSTVKMLFIPVQSLYIDSQLTSEILRHLRFSNLPPFFSGAASYASISSAFIASLMNNSASLNRFG